MPRFSDYVLSLHYFPLGAAVTLPSVAWFCGVGWLTCAALCTSSLLISAAAFYFEPLLQLTPMGGRYNVGLRELRGDVGAMRPPVTVFYPTNEAAAPEGIAYVPFNDMQYLRGIARYAGLPYFLMMDIAFSRAKMRQDATAVSLFREDGTPRPIVLFSHGLAGFPRLYTQLLMDVAARGAIIFAMTHMDGSAAYCRDAGTSIHIPINTDVAWTTKDREPQLEMRLRETRNTLPRIRSGELLRAIGYDAEVVKKYVAMDLPVHLVGHSFGGATALATALEEEAAAKAASTASAVASVVAYDPWSVPLRERLFHDRLTDDSDPLHFSTPTLQIFSEGWVRDKAQYNYFVELEKLVSLQEHTSEEAAVLDAANRKLKAINMTAYTRKSFPGTGHLTCTDASLFSPVVYRSGYMTVPPRAAIIDYAHDTVRFINALAGAIPIEPDFENDPVLAAALRR